MQGRIPLQAQEGAPLHPASHLHAADPRGQTLQLEVHPQMLAIPHLPALGEFQGEFRAGTILAIPPQQQLREFHFAGLPKAFALHLEGDRYPFGIAQPDLWIGQLSLAIEGQPGPATGGSGAYRLAGKGGSILLRSAAEQQR